MDPIPITEQLPEPNVPVLVYSPSQGKWWVVYIDDSWSPNYWIYQHGGAAELVYEHGEVKLGKFSHWCNLPDERLLHLQEREDSKS